VTAADCRAGALGFYSRFTSGRLVYPSVAADPDGFAEALGGFLESERHDVVLPLYEEALALARRADRFEGLARMPLPDYGTMLRFHDKRLLYGFAAEVGVPVPRTCDVCDREPEGIGYPLILKVPQSSSARGVARVRSRAEFRAARGRLLREHGLPQDAALLAQALVDGHQVCSLSFAWHGRPKGTLLYRNLCEFPFRGGAGVVRESVEHPGLEALVDELLRVSRWHGVVGFDFLVERATGRAFLIDANPRFTPGLRLAAMAGLDLVEMAISGDEPPPASPVAGGHRTRVEPLALAWAARALVPHRGYGTDLLRVADLLVPKSRSRSDLFAGDDLRSLRGIGTTLVDFLRSSLAGSPGLRFIRDSQFTDYASARTRTPAGGGPAG